MYNGGPYGAEHVKRPAPLARETRFYPAIDAIQELTPRKNPRAELRWGNRRGVNVGIKAGTNSLHGTQAFGRGYWIRLEQLFRERRARLQALPAQDSSGADTVLRHCRGPIGRTRFLLRRL